MDLRPLPPPISGSTYVSPAMTPTGYEPGSSYLPSLDAIAAELSVYANRQALQLPPTDPLPDVRVEFAGANLVLKTGSHRAPGQAVKIIAALESRAPALEIPTPSARPAGLPPPPPTPHPPPPAPAPRPRRPPNL